MAVNMKTWDTMLKEHFNQKYLDSLVTFSYSEKLRQLNATIKEAQDLVSKPRIFVDRSIKPGLIGVFRMPVIPDKWSDFCNFWYTLGVKLERFVVLERLSNEAKFYGY